MVPDLVEPTDGDEVPCRTDSGIPLRSTGIFAGISQIIHLVLEVSVIE